MDYQLVQAVAGGAVTGFGGSLVAIKLWTSSVERRLGKLEATVEDLARRVLVLESSIGEVRRDLEETGRQVAAIHRRLDDQRERDEARQVAEAERYGRLSAQLGMLLGAKAAPAA
jgi:septal ring factor EnvC (AmiA/AmiB activator)